MDSERFDRFARALAGSRTRRGALRLLAGGALGGLLGRRGREEALADHGCRHAGADCNPKRPGACCSGRCHKSRERCLCTAASCPQPPSPSCEAVCSGRFRCGFQNPNGAPSCDPGDPCIENATCTAAGECVGTLKTCPNRFEACVGGECVVSCTSPDDCPRPENCKRATCVNGRCGYEIAPCNPLP